MDMYIYIWYNVYMIYIYIYGYVYKSTPNPSIDSCGADVVLIQDDALQLLPAADGEGIGQGHGAAVAFAGATVP